MLLANRNEILRLPGKKCQDESGADFKSVIFHVGQICNLSLEARDANKNYEKSHDRLEICPTLAELNNAKWIRLGSDRVGVR